jgi:protein SCO1/2
MISMNSKKSVLINAGIIGVIIVGYITVTLLTTKPPEKILSFENVGLQVPLKSLNGDLSKIASLKEYRGQTVLIHFWASWCEACAADQKKMEQLAKSYHDNSSIKIIGIASSDTREAIEKSGLLNNGVNNSEKDNSYPQFLDETGNLALALGVKSLPQTLLIDPQGHVVVHLQRPIDPNQLDALENQMNQLSEDRIPPFAFESSMGQAVNQTTFYQKVWVADFIFTSCPGMCPMLTTKMHLIQEAFKGNDRLKLVSISVDPDTDTREVLQTYQRKYNVDPDQWYFLRGKMDEVKRLLVNGFKLGTMEEPKYHTGKLVLIDQASKIRGYYDADSSQSLDKLKTDIAKLLKP